MTYEPHLYQEWRAKNDTYGNPRRCAVIFDRDGTVLDVQDEGYAGYPRWVRDLHQLPSVGCSGPDYKAWLKMAAKVVTP